MTSILARLRRLEADAAEAPTQNNSNKIEGSSAASCSTPQTAASALLKSSQASVRAANNAASSEQRDTSSSSGDNVTSKDSKTDEGTTASESDRSPKRVATLPKLHAITCKKVPLAHLVWAPCYYFKVWVVSVYLYVAARALSYIYRPPILVLGRCLTGRGVVYMCEDMRSRRGPTGSLGRISDPGRPRAGGVPWPALLVYALRLRDQGRAEADRCGVSRSQARGRREAEE